MLPSIHCITDKLIKYRPTLDLKYNRMGSDTIVLTKPSASISGFMIHGYQASRYYAKYMISDPQLINQDLNSLVSGRSSTTMHMMFWHNDTVIQQLSLIYLSVSRYTMSPATQVNPGYFLSYDTQPGNGVGLFSMEKITEKHTRKKKTSRRKKRSKL